MLFKEKSSFNKRGPDYINQSITLNDDKTTFVKPMKTLSTNETPSRTVKCAPCHRYIQITSSHINKLDSISNFLINQTLNIRKWMKSHFKFKKSQSSSAPKIRRIWISFHCKGPISSYIIPLNSLKISFCKKSKRISTIVQCMLLHDIRSFLMCYSLYLLLCHFKIPQGFYISFYFRTCLSLKGRVCFFT